MSARRVVTSPVSDREGPTLRKLAFDERPPAMITARRVPAEAWLSRSFLVQVFDEDGCEGRVSVNRTAFDVSAGRWAEGITWDELQQVKREIGRGDAWAVEVYPADGDVIDVANMRHLWLLRDPPSYGWRVGTERDD